MGLKTAGYFLNDPAFAAACIDRQNASGGPPKACLVPSVWPGDWIDYEVRLRITANIQPCLPQVRFGRQADRLPVHGEGQ
jgi:hypothetical protein